MTPVATTYLRGLALNVPRAFQTICGYDLEDIIAASNPRLNNMHRSGAGKMSFAILDEVIRITRISVRPRSQT